MLAAVTRSPGEMVIDDVSDPGPARAGNVIVRPEVVGICGSDFHLFSGEVGALSGVRDFYPRIQGHEVSAIVEDPGYAMNTGDTVNTRAPGRLPGEGNRRHRLQLRHGAGFRNAISLVRANRASLAELFSHHFPLTRAAEAFEFARSRPPDAIKILVTVN